MLRLSNYERLSVQKRATLVERLLRALHLEPRTTATEKLRRWKSLYEELKRLRGQNARNIGGEIPQCLAVAAAEMNATEHPVS